MENRKNTAQEIYVLKSGGIVMNAGVNKYKCTGIQSNCIQCVHVFL